jgi:hypothetical protein
MGVFDFDSQCPFTESTPLALTGVPGLIWVSLIPFLLSIGEDSGKEVFTISHTFRQPTTAFSFAQFFVIQIFFISACMLDGVLITLYIVAFVLLALIFLFNPPPEDTSTLGKVKKIIHVSMAFTFFTYMIVVAFLIAVLELHAFDGFSNISPETSELRVIGLVVLFLQLGCYCGMMVLLAVNYSRKSPSERWPMTVSHLERLYALFFFIMLLLVPEGTLK